MTKSQFFFLLLALTLLLSCEVQTVNSATSDAGIAGERLLAQPPAGWQLVYQFNNIATRLSEYVPADEQKNDWQTKLTFESHSGLKDLDPISIIMGEIGRSDAICSHTEQFNLFTGLENNYPTSVRLIQCGNNSQTKRGEISLTKVIQGTNYLYIVKLVKRVPVFRPVESRIDEAEIAAWSTYIKNITLCDVGDDQHKCLPDQPATIPKIL